MVSCGLNNENMELKQRIIRNLEWANKRLKLQGKELDEIQLEIIEFCLLHDLQQLTIPVVSQQRELLLAYEKSKCPETWWVSKRQTECEIEDFLANNCG